MTTLKPANINQKALEILRSLTPSDEGHNPAPTQPHVHPVGPSKHKPYQRTGRLKEGWMVRRQGAVRAVSIINPVPYALWVEYGWYSLSGTYVPGHFMLKRALPMLRDLYVKENRKRLYQFLSRRPISSGEMVNVDYSEFDSGSFGSFEEIFEAFDTGDYD